MMIRCSCCKRNYDTDECPDDHDPEAGVCPDCIETGTIYEPDDGEEESEK